MSLIKKSIYVIKNYGLLVFFRKVFIFILSKLHIWDKLSNLFFLFLFKFFKNRIIKSLKVFSSSIPEEIFNFSFKFYYGFIEPMQIKEEFIELLKIFKGKNPKYILEIGTAGGGTLFCFCKLAKDDATIISIDLPGGPYGGGYPEWKVPIYQAFTKNNQKLYLLRKDSHKKETLEEVKKILNGNQLDFLFIDGDHSYEGVKMDFEFYFPLVKKGGIIAFHDIVPSSREPEIEEVPKFWKEIKDNYQNKEIIKDLKQIGYGIGIIFLQK